MPRVVGSTIGVDFHETRQTASRRCPNDRINSESAVGQTGLQNQTAGVVDARPQTPRRRHCVQTLSLQQPFSVPASVNEEHVRRPDDALLGLRFNAGRVQNALGTRGRGYRSKGEGQIERKGGEREREREKRISDPGSNESNECKLISRHLSRQ